MCEGAEEHLHATTEWLTTADRVFLVRVAAQRGLFERDPEPLRAFAGPSAAAFAGGLVLHVDADLSDHARCPAVGNTPLPGHRPAQDITSAVPRATPVRMLASSTPAAKGPSCASIASESRLIHELASMPVAIRSDR